MNSRTKVDMSAVRSEVQEHLKYLKTLGFEAPTLQKPPIGFAVKTIEAELAFGFAESAQNSPVTKRRK